MKKIGSLLGIIMLNSSVFASTETLLGGEAKDVENLQCKAGQTYIAGATKFNYMSSLDILFSVPDTTTNAICKTNGNRNDACTDVAKNKGFIVTTDLINYDILFNAIKQNKSISFEACISTIGTDGQLFLINLENSVGIIGISIPGNTFKVITQKK